MVKYFILDNLKLSWYYLNSLEFLFYCSLGLFPLFHLRWLCLFSWLTTTTFPPCHHWSVSCVIIAWRRGMNLDWWIWEWERGWNIRSPLGCRSWLLCYAFTQGRPNTTRNLGLDSVFFINVFKSAAISGILRHFWLAPLKHVPFAMFCNLEQ